MRDTIRGINLERVYKNITKQEDIDLYMTDIDTATVVLIFKPFNAQELCGQLTEAASNGNYVLTRMLIDKILSTAKSVEDMNKLTTLLHKSILYASGGACYIDLIVDVSHPKTLEVLLKYYKGGRCKT